MALPRRYLNVTLLLALFVSPLLLWAGRAATPAPLKADEPAFTLLAVGEQPLPADLYYLRSANDGVPVTVNATRRSELIKPAAKGLPLVFGIKRAVVQPGESPFQALCQVEWPAGEVNRVLVLLMSDGEKIHTLAMDDGERVFPRDSLRVVNLTGRPFLGRWGEFEGTLVPGPNPAGPFPVTPETSSGRFKLALGLREVNGSGRIIFSGWVDAWRSTRTLLLVRELDEELPEGVTGPPNTFYMTRWVVERMPVPAPAAQTVNDG